MQFDFAAFAASSPDVAAELVVSFLALDGVAALSPCANFCLEVAVHDLHWQPRVLRRTWALAPRGLDGRAAVKRWLEHSDAEPSSLSNAHLRTALAARCGSARTARQSRTRKSELERSLADAMESDLPERPCDGAGWWRRLYRALSWAEVLRLEHQVLEPSQCFGRFERLFVGQSMDWDAGWKVRYLEISELHVLRVLDEEQELLVCLHMGQCPTSVLHVHGQTVAVPPHTAVQRWPEDICSLDGAPLVACAAQALQRGGQHQWSFTIGGLGVDCLFRSPTEAQRDAWVERLNVAALATRRGGGFVKLGCGRLDRPKAVCPGGSEWERVGLREDDALGGLKRRLVLQARNDVPDAWVESLE